MFFGSVSDLVSKKLWGRDLTLYLKEALTGDSAVGSSTWTTAGPAWYHSFHHPPKESWNLGP